MQLLAKAYSSHDSVMFMHRLLTLCLYDVWYAQPVQYSTTYFVFELDLSFGQTIPNKVDFLNKTFTLIFSFNVHFLIFKRALLHFVPFDCQCSGLSAVRAVLPFLQTCYSTVDIIFLFTNLFFLVKNLKKVLIKIFNLNGQNFKSQSQIQLAK